MPSPNRLGNKSPATAAAVPVFSFEFTVPSSATERDFMKAAVLETRSLARKLWRDRYGYVSKKVGRPSLERVVWKACDDQWAQWGGRFPRHCSTANKLTQEVAKRIPGTRTDLKTIRLHVDHWIGGSLDMTEVPESWFQTRTGKKLVRQQFLIPIMMEAWASHPWTEKGPPPASAAEPIEEKLRLLRSTSDAELVRLFLEDRNK